MALIKCTGCGHDVSDKATECPHCGCPISKEKSSICKECGEPIPENASVCPNCGCPIESLGAAQEEVIYEEPKKKKGWIWALIVALLCLIGGGGYYAYSKFDDVGSDKDAIVELTPEFIKNIEKYDILCIFSEGLAAVSKDNKWGYINTKGQEVIPTKIDAYCVGRFSEGLAFVAKEKDKEVFSVIDTKGNTIFDGKGFCYSDKYPKCEGMPYFIDGKIYVPTLNNKYQVYDTKGAKLEVVNSKIGDSVYRQHEGAKYSVFFEYLSVSEKIDVGITKCGLKDSVGNVIISAKYDDIGNKEWFDAEVDNEYQYNACVSNGVVLVVLYEPNEDFYVELESKQVKHYGYADLKGNDTFTEHLKYLCQEAEKKAVQKMKEEGQGEYDAEIMDGNGNYDWLQGHWVGTDSGSGYPLEVIIDGDNLIQKINGQVCYNGSYQFNGEFIVYNDGNDFWSVDNERQVLTYDGSPMRKEDGSSSQSSSNSYSNNSSSSGSGYRFSSEQDVIGWLADKSFYNGSRRLRIRPDGVFLNDYCATFAPRVERWESWKALIRANTATGQRLSFLVDPIHGTITDEESDVFSLR